MEFASGEGRLSSVCFTEREALLGILVALTALCYLMTVAAENSFDAATLVDSGSKIFRLDFFREATNQFRLDFL